MASQMFGTCSKFWSSALLCFSTAFSKLINGPLPQYSNIRIKKYNFSVHSSTIAFGMSSEIERLVGIADDWPSKLVIRVASSSASSL